MKYKSLWNISVKTTSEAEDAVAELLGAILDLPVSTYHDNESGVSTVTVYLQQQTLLPRKIRADVSAGLERIRSCGLNLGSGKIVIARVRRENWAESWKRHFKPIEIGFKNRRDERCESPSSHNKSGTRATRPSDKFGEIAPDQAELEQAQASQRPGGDCAGSRIKFRHRSAPDHGILSWSNGTIPRKTEEEITPIGRVGEPSLP